MDAIMTIIAQNGHSDVKHKPHPKFDQYRPPAPSNLQLRDPLHAMQASIPQAEYFPPPANIYPQHNPLPSNPFQNIVPPPKEPQMREQNEDVEEVSKEELKRDLPNGYTLEEILKEMSDFSIQKIKMPNLEYKNTTDDTALENNIRMVFTERRLWNQDELKTALLDIVKMEDPLMHPSDRKKIKDKKEKRLSKGNKNTLKLFYPQLIALMFAVYCHTKRYSNMMIIKSDTQTVISHEIIKIWEHVFSQLLLICNTIMYANEKEKASDEDESGQGFLIGLPQNWNTYILRQRKKHNDRKDHKIELELKINALKQKLINMESEINKIKRDYEEKDAVYRQISTEYENVTQQIYGSVNVQRITDANTKLLAKYIEMSA